MPVIQLSLSRLGQYCKNKVDEKKIIETLPYLGLDIEDQMGDAIEVEYSPNRPDFSSEAGIARSLVGLLGLETCLPKYDFAKSNFSINVSGEEIRKVRPFIFGLYAEIQMTEETIKQLITMQEDLHNGIGRKRSKVAIGIHNADVIVPPIRYYAEADPGFSFVPLGDSENKPIREILSSTEQGISYGKLVAGKYPMLVDSKGSVLSMPPIINGELTRLKPGISKLFVDVTSTEERAGDTTTAIIASMLADIKARVRTVQINAGRKQFLSPDMTPREARFDLNLVNDTVGFNFDLGAARTAIERSRLEVSNDGVALIPRFRYDIIHPVDLTEEAALGYGIMKIEPMPVESSLVGGFDPKLRKLDKMLDVLVGLGLTEIWNLSLTTKEQVSRADEETLLKVDDPKSQSFEYLRSDLITSLLSALGASTHQEYPQKIFEQAPVFKLSRDSISGVAEEEHVGVAIAESDANYSAIHSLLDGFLKLAVGPSDSISLTPNRKGGRLFAAGRSALISLTSQGQTQRKVGLVGEISPEILEEYGLKVPVAGFELSLEPLLKD